MINEVFYAARLGDSNRLKELLSKEPELANTENEDGLTPLGYAAHYGNAAAVKVLLEYGAEVNAISHSKIDYIPSNTALHAAITGEREIEVIKELLMNKANPNILDSNGHTSLHTAAFHDDNVELITLLLEHGADVDAKVEDGNDAVSLAKERGYLRVAELLENRSED
ncbi:ankyrin repeat domain-containing protein [Paenibacillus sp. J5C_2022]|uniref:ankyrin repeat domain-containing protein n=1 Tax=Paenibacillus sp. J5C2022 TaxID=2977129 RepID=UPI0021D17CDA|nr:ankyrin repeat domain-containing protein [Paenibacillus sp. J5C2022]MCU6712822.1 ankyrin repeat domain-containing protein [Paenibacillus sp. J5C2022]